jgi:rhodanese-related sulfurtransferase
MIELAGKATPVNGPEEGPKMRINKPSIAMVLAIMALLSVPTGALLGGQDSGKNTTVNQAPFGSDFWSLPPGHFKLIAHYADLYLSDGPANGNYVVTWSFLNDEIDDPARADELGDFFVLDVRSTSAYCGGHIPGAVNIPFAAAAKLPNFGLLPTGQPILVVCASGMMSSQVASILGTLGYPVRTLAQGMPSVTGDLESCP